MQEKIKNNILYPIVIIAAVVVATIVLLSKAPEDSWKTFSSLEEKITFKYPETLDGKYIDIEPWPPQVGTAVEAFTCPEGDVGIQNAQTKKLSLNSKEYCVTTVSEGAAGSTYTQYIYTKAAKDNTLYLTFVMRTPTCANYEDPEKVACETELQAWSPDPTMTQILDSVRS